MKKKTILTLICALAMVVLAAGVTVAFYNTRAVGYEENVKIVSKDSEKIKILDFEIYYKDVDSFLDTARRFVPEIITV